MVKILPPFLSRFLMPRFAWLQVEVTTHCNAACRYCPHTLLQPHWQSRHLDPPVFQRLLPDVQRVAMVHLQGWGEPLLHPEFFTLVEWARQVGCRIGTTTNATLLTDDVVHRLVASGLDILAVSLTGLGPHHDYWRPGTSYDQVLDALRRLERAKRRQGRQTPRIHVAYLLLRSGLPVLSHLPEALAGLGIDQVVISTLDLVAAPHLWGEALRLSAPEERRAWQEQLTAVAAAGARRGLTIHPPPLPSPGAPVVCPENILRAAVISADGQVAPCVYLNVPAREGRQYLNHTSRPLQSCHFGRLQDQSFHSLWHSAPYRAFRRAWQTGHPPERCRHCLRLRL